MQSFNGTGNWKLTIKRTENGIAILRAETNDRHASLPDEIFGIPVTELGDHALAAGASEIPGEKVEIVCGRNENEFNNRNIESLSLSRNLKTIGNYAFLNCRKMQELFFYDNIENSGTEIFMNCTRLERIVLTRENARQGTFLAKIVSSLSGFMDVSVNLSDGSRLRLIFPEYYEVHTENGPTHFFNYNIEGGGYPYHHVFSKRMLEIPDYDALWKDFIYHGADETVALRLAWMRLRYPFALSEPAGEAYSEFVRQRIPMAIRMVMGENDVEGLRLILAFPELSGEDIALAQQLAREMNSTEAQAALLEKQHAKFGSGRRKSYDL